MSAMTDTTPAPRKSARTYSIRIWRVTPCSMNYEMHEALASTPSGLELTEAFGKIDGVVWRYIKDLLTMGICTAPNGMPVDFARESLIIESRTG